jgi:hypothetical protein
MDNKTISGSQNTFVRSLSSSLKIRDPKSPEITSNATSNFFCCSKIVMYIVRAAHISNFLSIPKENQGIHHKAKERNNDIKFDLLAHASCFY